MTFFFFFGQCQASRIIQEHHSIEKPYAERRHSQLVFLDIPGINFIIIDAWY
jgi:hypothetical protein